MFARRFLKRFTEPIQVVNFGSKPIYVTMAQKAGAPVIIVSDNLLAVKGYNPEKLEPEEFTYIVLGEP